MSEAKCPECDFAQHRGDCFDDEIDARLSRSLRAEGERLRAHGGGSITYVERCDSCETFRQRMIAEKARAEKAERERDAFMAERDDYVDGWAKQKARAEKAERERDEARREINDAWLMIENGWDDNIESRAEWEKRYRKNFNDGGSGPLGMAIHAAGYKRETKAEARAEKLAAALRECQIESKRRDYTLPLEDDAVNSCFRIHGIATRALAEIGKEEK